MTEYKTGDEVLVKGRVDYELGSGSYGVEFENAFIEVDPKEIYSKAPPFELGEEIEVRDNEAHVWERRIFSGYCEDDRLPFRTWIEQGTCTTGWKYARKIEKKDDVITAEEFERLFLDTDEGGLSITPIIKHIFEKNKGRRIG